MTVDLALASKLPHPTGAPLVQKGAGPPHEPQQVDSNPDDAEFVTLLSTFDGDAGPRAERPPTEMTGSDPRQSRQGEPESSSQSTAPPDLRASPKGVSASVNASLVNLTWPMLFVRTPVPEAVVSRAEGASESSLGRVTGDDVRNSRASTAENTPTKMAQLQFPDKTLAPDDERPSVSSASLSPHTQPEQEHGRPAMDAQSLEAIPRVAIKSLETHFPVVLANMPGVRVPTPSDKGQRNGKVDTAPTSRIAESGRRIGPQTETPNPEFENSLQRRSLGQTLAPDDEEDRSISLSPEAQSRVEATSERVTPDTASETIQRAPINSLETHFPVVLANMPGVRVPTPSDKGQRNGKVDTAPTSRIAESGRRIGPQTETPNPEFENSLQRRSLGQTLAPDDEEDRSISLSPEAQSRVEATPERVTPDTASSETIQRAPINSLETRVPAVLANMLVESVPGRDDNDQRNVSIHIARSSQIPETRQLGAATRVLILELEPASLGTVTVRMRISRSNVDVQIKVDSVDALQALNNARDKLVKAMQSSGCTVDSCTIQVGPTPGSADSSQHMTGDGGQNMASSGSEFASRANIGQEGAEHGARNDSPREEPHDPREGAPGDSRSSRAADRVHGLYL